MRAAIVGAGVAGLVAAYDLGRRGVECDVYERWPGLGGQAATVDVGGGVLLERYYHHLFTSDRHIASLYRELGMPDEIEWWPSSIAFFKDGRSHPFTSPLDLLRFKPLPLRTRLRLGFAVLKLQRGEKEVGPFESMSAREWLEREVGPAAWEGLWGPLMRAKFGDRAEDISMAWLWSKLTIRRQVQGREARGEVLGYPRGSFEPLFKALAREIERQGGRVLIDRPAARLGLDADGRLLVTPGGPDSFRRSHDPREFEHAGEPVAYDRAVATVSHPVFEQLIEPRLADRLSPGYLDRGRSIDYHATGCLLLELDRKFGDAYWTNVVDPDIPFLGLIEQTNFVPPERFGGRRFLYVANYMERDDPLLSLSMDEVIAHYEPGFRRANPGYSRDWIRNAWWFREPEAQPIVDVGYAERMPPLETGVPGLVLANTASVYPEDRGTNYAVRLGHQAAETVLQP